MNSYIWIHTWIHVTYEFIWFFHIWIRMFQQFHEFIYEFGCTKVPDGGISQHEHGIVLSLSVQRLQDYAIPFLCFEMYWNFLQENCHILYEGNFNILLDWLSQGHSFIYLACPYIWPSGWISPIFSGLLEDGISQHEHRIVLLLQDLANLKVTGFYWRKQDSHRQCGSIECAVQPMSRPRPTL